MKKILSLLAIGALLLGVTACGTTSTTTADNMNSENSTQTEAMADDQTNETQIQGEWQYEGSVGDGLYDVNLDLEAQNNFSLKVEREGTDDTADSVMTGTYSVDGDTLELKVDSVVNNNGYFTDSVKTDSTLEFEYVLSSHSLTLKNVSSTLNTFPDELVLYKD